MGKPAARMGDQVMTCGDPPAPTGTIIAAGTVLIEKRPAAKQGDKVVGVDIHIVMVPSPAGPVPTPLPHPFMGQLDGELSSTVNIEGKPAAMMGSTASASPSHTPTPPGTAFQVPPQNKGNVIMGAPTVLIGNGGGSGSGGGGGGKEAAAQGGQEGKAVEQESHYLDVKVKDKGGFPVSGGVYSLKGPDGKVTDGKLTGHIKQGVTQEGSHEVKLKAITKVEWSSDRIKVGDKVELRLETVGYDDGVEATFDISEKDSTGREIALKHLSGKLDGGKVAIEWTYEYPPEGDPATIGKGEARPYSFPKVFFAVSLGAERSRSGVVRITDDLEIELKDDKGDPIPDEEYVVYLASGEIRTGRLDRDGKAVVKDVPVRQSRVVFPNQESAKKLPKQ